jgi:hypothetical protein
VVGQARGNFTTSANIENLRRILKNSIIKVPTPLTMVTTSLEDRALIQRFYSKQDVEIFTSRCEDDAFMLDVSDALEAANVCSVKRLKLFTFYSNDISTRTIERLADSLRINTSLTDFELVGDCRDMSLLLEQGVAASKSIKRLGLHGCGAGVVARVMVARLFNLQGLVIGNTLLGREEWSLLTTALSRDGSLKRLTELRLSNCRVNRSGAAAMARILETNETLKILDLQGNPSIGSDGVVALLANNNSCLKELILTGCGLGRTGAIALAGWIKKNNSLERLSLWGNPITIGKQALVGGISCNLSLVRLDINLVQDALVNEQIERHLAINRFRKTWLSQDRTAISPALYPHVFARVSAKPSALFLFLQENRDGFIPYLPP